MPALRMPNLTPRAIRPSAFVLLALLALLALAPAAARATSRRPPTVADKARAAHPGKSTGKKKVSKNAPVELYAVNRREAMALRFRDTKGRPVKGMQRRFDHFLRCHYTNVEHKMDPRLMRLLFQTGHH